MDEDLLDQLSAFVLGLPATIRGDLIFMLLGYSGHITSRNIPADRDAMDDAARAYFATGSSSSVRIGMVISTAALLDYALASTVANLDRLPRVIAELPPEMQRQASTRAMLAGHPLRARHWMRANKAWAALRAKNFDIEAISRYSDRLTFQGTLTAPPPRG